MPAIPSFADEKLRAICGVLGETNGGLTNSEIAQLLRSASIRDPTTRTGASPYFYTAISKKDRLYAALSARQAEDKCANNVLSFIMKAMDPVRYASKPGQFEYLKERLNIVLAFSGLSIGNDGMVRTESAVTTLDEAQRRASALKLALLERNVHPDVLRACRAELLQDNYFHAVLESTKSVADKIRMKTGFGYDGTTLVDAAFGSSGGKQPAFTFNSFDTPTKIDEHKGITNLLHGMFGAFRNVTAHEPRIAWPIEEEDALDLFSLASYLHRRIDKITVANNA